ncbi:hypothetical protein scyTo_0022016, partial [Scyliorhinus torazame]|nr:hypothetical protein [Scyliorhinus torazame]
VWLLNVVTMSTMWRMLRSSLASLMNISDEMGDFTVINYLNLSLSDPRHM